MNTPEDGSVTQLVIEGSRLLDAPRTLLAERFLEWFSRESFEAIELPDGEVVVRIEDSSFLSRPYVPADVSGAVGCAVFSLGDSELHDRWEIAVAYGEDYRDEADVASWLVTIPHELQHLSHFARRFDGRLPVDVGRQELREAGVGHRDRGVEEDVEGWSRRVVDRFVATHGDLLDDPELLLGAETHLGRQRSNRRR